MYAFFRVDPKLALESTKENPYYGECLSDSWGSGAPKDNLLWDGDFNSIDTWMYEDMYPELIAIVNESLKEGYTIHMSEGKYVDGEYQHTADYEGKETLISL